LIIGVFHHAGAVEAVMDAGKRIHRMIYAENALADGDKRAADLGIDDADPHTQARVNDSKAEGRRLNKGMCRRKRDRIWFSVPLTLTSWTKILNEEWY